MEGNINGSFPVLFVSESSFARILKVPCAKDLEFQDLYVLLIDPEV